VNLKGYLSFYASGVPWECFVDDEKVAPQEGKILHLRRTETYTDPR
jgi:hypothetical protein